MSRTASDGDSPVRVSVTPSQSSYFAGEQFSVTITFTNTRSPDPRPARAVSHLSHNHKRAAHSVSSVPLARPPTSPATPRTALPLSFPRTVDSKLTRKGLVGRKEDGAIGAEGLPPLEGHKKLLPRSLSVIISPHSLLEQTGGESVLQVTHGMQPETSHGSLPPLSSPLVRTRSSAIAAHHPHARKQSVLDGQIQLQDIPPMSPSPLSAGLSAASTSTFSLSLDTISEGAQHPILPTTSSLSPSTETPIGVNFETPSTSLDKRPIPPRRPAHLGLGHGLPPSSTLAGRQLPQTAFPTTFPQTNTELLLYSYAQLVGTFTIASPTNSIPSQPQAQMLNAVRAKLLKRQVVGGGSMDITSSLQSPSQSRKRHGRSSSLSSGIMSLLSPPTLSPAPTESWSPSHRARTPSMMSAFLSSNSSSTQQMDAVQGYDLQSDATVEQIDPETPLPTFEVQPAMLAVDLTLAPGEVRSYTYSVTLPDNLPPTFKGRALKFSYQLVVGTCRAGSFTTPSSTPGINSSRSSGMQSSSRVMKVPIRVYNNVVVGKPQSPYDLLWPVAMRKELAAGVEGKVTEDTEKMKSDRRSFVSRRLPSGDDISQEGLRDYARRLLDSFPNPDARGVPLMLPKASVADHDRDGEDEGELTGCREAVEVLTRNPKKVSYDVTKDNVKVAVLTFTKSAYRLGETVLGVLELNDRSSRARVLKLSAMLEAHESLPSSIAPSTLSSRNMRKVHAEHHSSFMPSTLRSTFALDIPSDATPAFQVDIGDTTFTGKPGGLEWKVRICLLVAIASESAIEGVDGARLKHLVRDGRRGEWGSSWKATDNIAPMERAKLDTQKPVESQSASSPSRQSWASFFTSPFLAATENAYHDGDDEVDEDEDEGEGDGDFVDELDGEEGWQELRVETVECEVPIKVWPGNTAFKAVEVTFDV